MDKVIIDGIDISECPLFDKKTGCYHTFNGECVKDSCAVYKWLLEHKRLQEENKQLKEENELIKERSKELYTFSATYENDKLKQALQEIREIILEMCGEQCGACFIEMCNRKCRYAKIQDKINEVIGAE